MAKATGIIRRFDDLGRIVIPRDIRRELFSSSVEGKPMEFFTEKDGTIILKPYHGAEDEWNGIQIK